MDKTCSDDNSSYGSLFTRENEAAKTMKRRQSCGWKAPQAVMSGPGAVAGWSDASSEIFYIEHGLAGENEANLDAKGSRLVHHSNLDVSQLTVRQQLYLALLYYLTVRNVLRGAVIVFALIWFTFNAVQVFKDFLTANSVVYMEYRKPSITMPPGVSVCIVCTNCSIIHKPVRTQLLFGSDDQTVGSQRWPDIYDLGTSCTLTRDGITPSSKQSAENQQTCNYATNHVLNTVFQRFKCYTFFSNVYGHMDALDKTTADKYHMEFQRFPYIRLSFANLSATPKVLRRYDQHESMTEDGVFVAIHDPNVPPSMQQLVFSRVKHGKTMNIKFSKKIEEWNLVDSIRLWGVAKCYNYTSNSTLENYLSNEANLFVGDVSPSPTSYEDLQHFHSRGECFLKCIWKLSSFVQDATVKRCLNYYSIIPSELNTELLNALREQSAIHNQFSSELPDDVYGCGESSEQLTNFTLQKQQCETACIKDCSEHTFYAASISEIQDVSDGETAVDIEWNTGSTIYIRNQDKICITSFLGTLGGHAHFWLGISAISILSWIARIVSSGSNMLRMETSHGCSHFLFLWCRVWRNKLCVHNTHDDSQQTLHI